MTATWFTKVLDAAFVPFIANGYLTNHRFHEDNDPKHTSRWAQCFFTQKNINWWSSPPESPDLNPIENVWGTMKQAICNEYKPRTLPQLEEAIKHYWNTKVYARVCTTYINHNQIVLPAVVECEGEPLVFKIFIYNITLFIVTYYTVTK